MHPVDMRALKVHLVDMKALNVHSVDMIIPNLLPVRYLTLHGQMSGACPMSNMIGASNRPADPNNKCDALQLV